METTLHPVVGKQLKQNVIKAGTVSAYEKLVTKLEFSYFGLIVVTILVGSMVGGIASMYILKNHAPVWQLAACAAVSMGNNVAGIGQAPAKWVLNFFFTSLVVNTVLILVNIF
ncbi:MAG: hypothetical protein K0S32_2247 [Bacteroidetes bacterium]|jgi:hypothetical protein|nr:hypothetical protein [Bacteroidota bacterium]